MRDKNGFLDINDYIDLGLTRNGGHRPHRLSNKKNEYVFKVLEGIHLYRELVYPIILRNIEINAVENDLAIFKGEKGILSKSFRGKENYLPRSVFVKKYCNKVLNKKYEYKILSNFYNIRDLNNIYKWYCSTYKIFYDEEINKNELFLEYIFQILFANDDNASVNREVSITNGFKFSPFYDFEYYGNVNLNEKVENEAEAPNYILGFNTSLDDKPRTCIKTIEHFKHYATKEEMEIFRTYLELLQMLRIDDQYEEIEANIHAHIPEPTKLKLKKDYESNLKNVDALVNDKK